MTVVCQQKLNIVLTFVENNRNIIVEICRGETNQIRLKQKVHEKMHNICTKNTIIRLILIWLMVFIFMFFGKSIEGLSSNNGLAIGIFLLVLVTIIGASFGVVKEADELAHKLGQPYGTLILTLSIVSIEVIL